MSKPDAAGGTPEKVAKPQEPKLEAPGKAASQKQAPETKEAKSEPPKVKEDAKPASTEPSKPKQDSKPAVAKASKKAEEEKAGSKPAAEESKKAEEGAKDSKAEGDSDSKEVKDGEPTPDDKTKVVKRERKEKKEKLVEKIKNLPKDAGLERKRKPKFVRAEHAIRKKLKNASWRRPRGIDSKQLEEKRGKPRIPKIGYKNQPAVRGLHPSGLAPVQVRSALEASSLDSKTQGAVIWAKLGRLKRNEVIKALNEKGVTVLNPRKGEA